MEKQKTIFKRCPIAECRTISGFCLTEKDIKKDGRYLCQECGKETKLSNWLTSTDKNYLKWIRDVEVAKRLGK